MACEKKLELTLTGALMLKWTWDAGRWQCWNEVGIAWMAAWLINSMPLVRRYLHLHCSVQSWSKKGHPILATVTFLVITRVHNKKTNLLIFSKMCWLLCESILRITWWVLRNWQLASPAVMTVLLLHFYFLTNK